MLALVIALSIFSVPASFSVACILGGGGGCPESPSLAPDRPSGEEACFSHGGTRSSRVGSDWSTSGPRPSPEPITAAESPGWGWGRGAQARLCDRCACGPLGLGGCSVNRSRGLWLADRRTHACPKATPVAERGQAVLWSASTRAGRVGLPIHRARLGSGQELL